MDTQEQARAHRARNALGAALDDVESRFHPRYVGQVAAWALKQSWRSHRVAWGVAAGVTIAIIGGLAVWAVLSTERDDV
jgi:cobalamin biosynthesis protein CobD/CbiB